MRPESKFTVTYRLTLEPIMEDGSPGDSKWGFHVPAPVDEMHLDELMEEAVSTLQHTIQKHQGW